MAFICHKIIHGKKYAYEITSTWDAESKKVKKTSKYLGIVMDYLRSVVSGKGVHIKVCIIMLVLSFSTNANTAFAHKKEPLERVGDILQIANPIVAASISSQEKGIGHFAMIYGQSIGVMGSIKLLGKQGKWDVSKRPSTSTSKRVRFDGFPSGHTTSAWTAASYVRVFSEEYKVAAIPLYLSAALTGYSRVKAKEHTPIQVFMAVALSEAVTAINYRLAWSNEYRTTSVNFAPGGVSISLKINF